MVRAGWRSEERGGNWGSGRGGGNCACGVRGGVGERRRDLHEDFASSGQLVIVVVVELGCLSRLG